MPPFPQLEFHRRGVGLVPAPGTTESAIHVEMDKARPMRSCTCAASRRKTCDHLKELSRRLAAEGVWFANAYSAATWTKPSIATLMTSLYPSEHGLVRLGRADPNGRFVTEKLPPSGTR